MSNMFDGLVEVNLPTIRKAANNALKYVEKLRNERLEEDIQKEMNKKFFPAKTRLKAIKRCKSKNECRFWGYDIIAWGIEQKAETLLNSIKSGAGGTIYLSLNYAEFVNRFLDND